MNSNPCGQPPQKEYEIIAMERHSPDYPENLRFIKKAPEILYCRGDMALCKLPCLGVVGARKATPYGKWVAYHLAKRAASLGIAVVSGMASGIDAAAHRGALDAGGKTIAVFGCGPDICYPKGNQELMKAIKEKGLILSEYAPGTQPLNFQFPMRNRIISGLSSAVVIVEAGLSSGSLITAEWALEQGRDVYAVPGNINSIYSIGTNKLIQDGAIPLVVLDDFLQSFLASPNPPSGSSPNPPTGSFPNAPTGFFPNPPAGSATNRPGSSTADRHSDFLQRLLDDPSMGRDEKRILTIVAENGEVTMDYLCKTAGKPASQVGAIVTILEMKGRLQTALGKIFIAKYR